jgi:hypothetical protein
VADLVEFIKARIDEDEATARAVEASWRCVPGTGEIVASDGTNAEVCGEAHWEGVGEHIARHDPARVLREVEARRRTLARHHRDPRGACVGCGFSGDLDEARTGAPEDCPELLDMASVWSDHPDCHSEWAP